MIKIEVTNEIRDIINRNHKEYIEQTCVPKLESKIKFIKTDKKCELLKKLFGDTKEKRKNSIVEFCLSAHLNEKIEVFNGAFRAIYGFEFSDISTKERKKAINDIRKDLDEILNYRKFNSGIKLKHGNKWNRHEFITRLGIKVCPYCNRQYITSYEDGIGVDMTTADADHYYPKAEYPILQMNIFNLVPSCSVCNSRTKGSSNKRHLYPYVDPSNSVTFYIPPEMGDNVSKILIDTKRNISAEASIEVFKLDKIYQAHLEEASEVKQNAKNYFIFGNKAYEALLGLKVPFDIFSTWFSFMGKEPSKEPLIKLKQDIFNQMMEELKK